LGTAGNFATTGTVNEQPANMRDNSNTGVFIGLLPCYVLNL